MKHLLYIIPALFFLCSCTEEIDLDLETMPTKPVITGILSDTEQWVRLSETSSYLSSEKNPVISNAVVSVSDGSISVPFQESSTEKGLYLPPYPLLVQNGKTYTLNVKASIDQTEKEFSASSTVAHTPVIDSLNLISTIDFNGDNYWFVTLSYQDVTWENYYLSTVSVNRELEQGLESYHPLDNANNRSTYVKSRIVSVLTKRPNSDELIQVGDTITAVLSGISKDYYTFLRGAKEETSGRNPLFSGPPANVQGNISNGALGVFATYTSSAYSVIIRQVK